MSFFRRKGQIVHGDPSSNLSLASSSSSTPAQAVGSLSKDAASVEGKIRKFLHLDKRSHTDTTGDVTATSSNSESLVVQSNKSSITSSLPLANAQTTTIKFSPDNKNLAGTLSENKTANAGRDSGDREKHLRGAGQCAIRQGSDRTGDYSHHDRRGTSSFCSEIAVLIHISHYRQSTHVRGEWDKVKDDLIKVRDIVFEFRYGGTIQRRCPMTSRLHFESSRAA